MSSDLIPAIFCEPRPVGFALQDTHYCQIDWEAVNSLIGEAAPETHLQEFFIEAGRAWITRLREQFGSRYRFTESENFFMVSAAEDCRAQRALLFLEDCLTRIKRGLSFLPEKPGYGKWPVLCLELGIYDEYLSDFIQEAGEYAATGGVFLNRGYGHFAIPNESLEDCANVLVHELTHGLLSLHALPAWLDEALAQTVEQGMSMTTPYHLDREIIQQHQRYWNEELIQSFWSGESFQFPDEGAELSYHLALFLYHALRQSGTIPQAAVKEFISKAKREDAGHAACLEVLGLDLGEIVGHLLGEGNWSPSLTPPSPDAPHRPNF
jgi:hypothetical protein